MAMERIASELLRLDVPPNDDNFSSENAETKLKQSTKYAIVYWIETQEFNVMPLSKIPKDKRQEGESATACNLCRNNLQLPDRLHEKLP